MAFDYTNYKQVEYLLADASTSQTMRGPYIDLGLAGGYYRYVCKGYWTKTSQYVQALFGGFQSYANDYARLNTSSTTVRYDVRGQNKTIANVALNTDHLFEFCSDPDNAYMSIDGNTQTLAVGGSSFTAPNRLLFAYNQNGTPSGVSSFKMYYFKIYDLNDDLVMDLVPAQQRSSPNKYGMYDTIGETFYGTQNSYDFTGGPEVSGGPETYVKIGGTWKKADAVYVKVGGTWTEGSMNVKVSGSWKDS